MNSLKQIFKTKKILTYIILSIIALIAFYIVAIIFTNMFSDSENTIPTNSSVSTDSENVVNEKPWCNVAKINLHGRLDTYVYLNSKTSDVVEDESSLDDTVGSEDIVYSIKQANQDDEIKAIVIEVDSGGGLPVAGEEVANALKNSTKPTVGIIRGRGLSASYLAVTGAEYIFASRNSDVGSIGVTTSYLENINKDKKFIQLSVGKYKDSGNPDKPITEEEKNLIMRDVRILHKNFIEDVATNRDLSIENVTKLADGSSVLGDKAKELGLIDEIGGWSEAEQYLKEKIGERVEVCW